MTQDGTQVTPKIGSRRKSPNLTDLLDTAASYGARRIMLCGEKPEPAPGVRHWLLVQTPGWKPTGHKLKAPMVGRFEHAQTGQKVDVRTAGEWFPKVSDPDSDDDTALPLKPWQAREAWNLTESVIQEIAPKQFLLYTPSRTGMSVWWQSLPRDKDKQLIIPPHIDRDIADDLHRTSGQHHVEHLVAGDYSSAHPDVVPLIDPAQHPRIDTFTYVDGRFMYAALGRELGVGPGVRLNRSAAYDLMANEPYARAWYEVRFTVPEGWRHIGIFGVQHENPADGWFYPNRPGARHVTWADAAEVAVALAHGWLVEPLQAIRWQKARPIDNFMSRLNKAREAVEGNAELPWMLRKAVSAALRQITIQTVGSFASRGTTKTILVESALDVPAEYQGRVTRHGKLFAYEAPGDRWESQNYHPELAIQVWGRGRARLLDAPTATGLHDGGALRVPGESLIGVNGDAIYTTTVPLWSLSEARGGGDDGKTGRLRIKGSARGNFQTPATREARDRLRDRAEKIGPKGAITEQETS
ncbi:MAG: hypothetical protein ACTICP_11695 [Microbacterium sp.]